MYRSVFVIFIVSAATVGLAQDELIFEDGFEPPYPSQLLNDTGIIQAGEYPWNNSAECLSVSISAEQDCHAGRDATHNDDADGHAGFSFSKLDEHGVPLEDQSVDYEVEPWACVWDHVTGLVWEVKTDDGGVHDKDNLYQWGGLTAIGREHPGRKGTYHDPSWNELVKASNSAALCGITDWSLPTVAELASIVNKGTRIPAIDDQFFPQTITEPYWTASPSYENSARFIRFYNGRSGDTVREALFRVRLVGRK